MALAEINEAKPAYQFAEPRPANAFVLVHENPIEISEPRDALIYLALNLADETQARATFNKNEVYISNWSVPFAGVHSSEEMKDIFCDGNSSRALDIEREMDRYLSPKSHTGRSSNITFSWSIHDQGGGYDGFGDMTIEVLPFDRKITMTAQTYLPMVSDKFKDHARKILSEIDYPVTIQDLNGRELLSVGEKKGVLRNETIFERQADLIQ